MIVHFFAGNSSRPVEVPDDIVKSALAVATWLENQTDVRSLCGISLSPYPHVNESSWRSDMRAEVEE